MIAHVQITYFNGVESASAKIAELNFDRFSSNSVLFGAIFI